MLCDICRREIEALSEIGLGADLAKLVVDADALHRNGRSFGNDLRNHRTEAGQDIVVLRGNDSARLFLLRRYFLA